MKNFFQADLTRFYHPWPYFLVFLPVQFLLSSSGLSTTHRLFLSLFGLVLPLGLAFSSLRKQPSAPGKKEELFRGSLPWPAWAALGVAALLLRFWGLGGSGWWPGGDQAIYGMGAIALLRHWNWSLFETFSQVPTTQSRLCWLLLRWTHNPLFSIQFLAASLSWMAIPMGYLACRQYFSRPFSVLATFLLAYNFWALQMARTGYPVGLFPLWELAVFYALGRFLAAEDSPRTKGRALFLGFITGLGPYILTPWPVVSLFAVLVLVWKAHRSPWAPGAFLASLVATLGPFLYFLWEGGYGGHIRAISVWNHFSPQGLVDTVTGYLSGLFWDSRSETALPGAGGLLNVFLGACFFLGILELYRIGKKGPALALGLALALFLLPGFLSYGYEPIRILSTLPILLVVAAFGIQALVSALPSSRRMAGLALILAVIAGMDVLRIPLPGARFWPFSATSQGTQGEGNEAFELLQPYFSQQGPCYLFSELIPETDDPSLDYASYFMNAAWNTGLPRTGISWAAVLTDYHYQPFLSRRFPGSRWVSLLSPRPGLPGRHILGILPVTGETSPVFRQWSGFYGPLQDINWKILDLSNGLPRSGILKDLLAFYPSVPQDPFLQSCFFEKLAFNYTCEKTFHPEDSQAQWAHYSAIFHACFAQSYQDPALCEKFGRLLASEGQQAEAREIFKEALKQSPGNSWLLVEMRELGLED